MPFHPTRIIKHRSMDLDMAGADPIEVEYHPGSWMHSWHAGKDFHVNEAGRNPSHPERHWRSAGGGIHRLGSNETAAETSEYGSVAFSALEAAALRSALSAERKEKVVVSDKPGGGLEAAGMAERARHIKQSGHAFKDLAARHAGEPERVRYPRNGLGTDPRHVIARKTVGPSIKPGTVPWARPSAKPENWTGTQTDEEFIKNGPAGPLLPETDMHSQSLPHFVSGDPICAAIRSTRPLPQDYRLYRLFEKMDASSPLSAMSLSSSQVASRPYTGATKSTRTPSSIALHHNEPANTSHKRLLGNPAAFKIMELDSVWGIDDDLLVEDKQTLFGSRTHREGLQRRGMKPSSIRVATADLDARGGSQSTARRVCNAIELTPRSPIIRELVMANPRAKARNRQDIPLVASPSGCRAPVSHGSFVPAGPRTVKTTSQMFSTAHVHGRGTKYTTGGMDRIIASTSFAEPERMESRDDVAGVAFVNLNTFDEHFSSPQRLTPLSRRTLEHAGFDTGYASSL